MKDDRTIMLKPPRTCAGGRLMCLGHKSCKASTTCESNRTDHQQSPYGLSVNMAIVLNHVLGLSRNLKPGRSVSIYRPSRTDTNLLLPGSFKGHVRQQSNLSHTKWYVRITYKRALVSTPLLATHAARCILSVPILETHSNVQRKDRPEAATC